MKILKQYIPTGARHKLLFTSHHAEGMNFVDIGALLARAIESSLSNRHLSFVAEEELEKIIKANVCHSSEIGDYIAIRNIGSTPSAILGALEPVTAVIIGVTIFGENFSCRLAIGIALILSGVIIIVAKSAK